MEIIVLLCGEVEISLVLKERGKIWLFMGTFSQSFVLSMFLTVE